MKTIGIIAFAMATLALLQGCAPIHPRWQNASSHDIVIAYLKGPARYDVRIKRGREAVPLAPVDFKSVETIEVKDDGRLYRFDHAEILNLHAQCGHGFACWISYDDTHKLHVSTSAPSTSKA